jgi:hypothetical protein
LGVRLYRDYRSKFGILYLKLKQVCGFVVASFLARTLFRVPNSNLSVGLDTTKLSDGTGAQFQRMLATRLISHVFNIGYIHQEIKHIQVHPLDPFQDAESYSSYLKDLNLRIQLTSTGNHSSEDTVFLINSISLHMLVKFQIVSKYRGQKIILLLVDPYPVSELLVNYFPMIKTYLVSDYWSAKYSQAQIRPTVVVHHRQGVGGKAIYPGQRIARELDIAYFIRILDQIKSTYENCLAGQLNISIHTDAPQEEINYSPPKEQLELWEGTPNYRDGKVTIIGTSLSEIFQSHGYSVSINIGGDPLDAILEMSHADYLVTARSSLSYVGGLLNSSGRVFSAPGFWHRPLNTWVNGGKIV